ncbi:MAG: M48 family metallopeptidase [Planctomycetes bacterium]|nr:M48 family metallopeptidase [Planctomycetota bacterium]
MSARIPLTNLQAGAFQHPTDVAALEVVRGVPFINFAMRKMMEYGFERLVRMQCMADTVKVGPRTCPSVDRLANEAALILDMPRPDFFLDQEPIANAFTTGVEHPIIVLQTGLVEMLSEEELLAVIGHEMGHIKCGHVLYLMTARFLTYLADLLGLAAIAVHGLRFALLEWMRKAELSCDRAAVLTVQDRAAALAVLMKLAGGARGIKEGMTADAFLEQAKEYEAMVSGKDLNRLIDFISRVSRTHPFPVVRAAEMHAWAEGTQYRDILAGRCRFAERTGGIVCPHCNAHLPEEVQICRFCGCSVKGTTQDAPGEFWGALGGFGKTIQDGFGSIFGKGGPSAPGGTGDAGGAPAAEPPKPAGDTAPASGSGICPRCGATDQKGNFCASCAAPLKK